MEFVLGILLIVLGFVAMALPITTSFAVVLVLGWALIVAGVIHLFAAFRSGTFADGAMKAIIGLAYLFVAFAVLRHPAWGVTSLALVVSAAFVVEGIATIALYLAAHDRGATFWLLLNGAITLLLGLVLWNLATTTPVTIVSALVGVNLVVAGMIRILLAGAVRRFRQAVGA